MDMLSVLAVMLGCVLVTSAAKPVAAMEAMPVRGCRRSDSLSMHAWLLAATEVALPPCHPLFCIAPMQSPPYGIAILTHFLLFCFASFLEHYSFHYYFACLVIPS